jgi:membrane protease YdiL (CAAX protease family)
VFLSAGEKRLRAGWRLVVLWLLTGALLVACVLTFRFVIGLRTAGDFDPLGRAMLVLCVTASVYICRRWIDRRSFRSLGLSLDRHTLPDLVCGFLTGAVATGFCFALLWSLGWLTIKGYAWNDEPAAEIALEMAAWLFIIGIVPAWNEELLARGYWLQNLKDGLGLAWAIFLSWVLFCWLHTSNPNLTPLAMINLFLGTFELIYAWLRTRQLWLAMGLHAGWNFFLGPVFGFPVSGKTTFVLIEQTQSGPEWFTGHAFGPEGGLVGILKSLICMAIIWGWTARRMPCQESPPSDACSRDGRACGL